MRKLSIYNSGKTYELAISTIKYICGNNYDLKFEIAKVLKQYINKTAMSERQKENNSEILIKINDQTWKEKSVLFEINQFYDLSSDIKMQSKSLILKYYETYLHDLGLQDEMLTLNMLFKSLEDIINQESSLLFTSFVDMNEKQIIKLLLPYLFKDELQCNAYDFTYEELIIFQLKIVSYIAKHHFETTYFIIIDLPLLTEPIINELSTFTNNSIVLVFTNQPLIAHNINDYCLCFSNILDLSNEEKIYEDIINRYHTYITYEEVITEMKNIIAKEHTEKTKFVLNLIK